jgi:phage tail tape-measure protein
MHTTTSSEQATGPTADAHPGTVGVGTTAGGVIGGAVAGAAIGTLAGPVGTAIGATIGAIAGGLVGKAVAEGTHATAPQDGPPVSAGGPDHEAVAKQAYYIWEEWGRTDGHALDDWLRAESLLKSR